MEKRISTGSSGSGYRSAIIVNGDEYPAPDLPEGRSQAGRIPSDGENSDTGRNAGVYTDVPLRPRSRDAAPLMPEETVQRFRAMRRLAFSHAVRPGHEDELFYRQGLLMADYEDDFTFGEEILRYCPTYQSLSDTQLRGYFGWRSRVRAGDIRQTTLAYVLIYLYELLCRIGPDGQLSPEEAFRQLVSFTAAYEPFEPSLRLRTDNWLTDFAAYHDLSPALLDDFPQIAYDKNLITLIHAGERTDDELFSALAALSAYNIQGSALYEAEPDALRFVLCGVFREMSDIWASSHKTSYIDSLFGVIVNCPCTMFRSAVFYDPQRHRDCVFRLNEIHSYSCVDNRWFCEKYYGSRGRSKGIGDLAKSADSRLRAALSTCSPIKQELTARQVTQCIDRQIELYRRKKRREDAMNIQIDVQKLPGIRRSADSTRDKLIIDEEEAALLHGPMSAAAGVSPGDSRHGSPTALAGFSGILQPGPGTDSLTASAGVSAGDSRHGSPTAMVGFSGVLQPGPGADSLTASAGVSAGDSLQGSTTAVAGVFADNSLQGSLSAAAGTSAGASPHGLPAAAPGAPQPDSQSVPALAALTDPERRLLVCLLEEKPYMDLLSGLHLIPDVVADSINEKLYDLFSDTVIEGSGSGLTLVEDYASELAALFEGSHL